MKMIDNKCDKEDIYSNIIYRIRNEHNLTQKEFGDLIEVSDRTVSKWENNLTVPDLNSIRKICDALGISPSYIINDNKTYKDGIRYANKRIANVFKYVLNHIFVIGFIVIFSLLLVFFLNNYSGYEFYKLKYSSDNITIDRGYFIVNKYVNVLVIDNINLNKIDYDPTSIKLELYTYVNGDKFTIYEADTLEDIYIEELHGYPEVLSNSTITSLKRNLYLKIDTTDKDNKKYSYDTIIDLSDEFVNNKIAYNGYVKDDIPDDKNATFISRDLPKFESPVNVKFYFDDNDIEAFSINVGNSLKDLGYKYDSEKDVYTKIYKNEKIEYYPNVYLLKYEKKVNKLKYSIYYHVNNNLIYYSIFDKNENKIMYLQYNVNEKFGICMTGNCENYNDDINYILAIYKEINETLQS